MRFRLDAQHYLHDRLLEAGTVIGDDTPYPFRNPDGDFTIAPSRDMTPLDDEAASLYKQVSDRKQNWGRPVDSLPLNVAEGTDPRALSANPTSNPPVTSSPINRTVQPPIPAPIEHLQRPNNMRPDEQPRTVLIPQELVDQIAEEAGNRDVRDAMTANERDQRDARDRLQAAGKDMRPIGDQSQTDGTPTGEGPIAHGKGLAPPQPSRPAPGQRAEPPGREAPSQGTQAPPRPGQPSPVRPASPTQPAKPEPTKPIAPGVATSVAGGANPKSGEPAPNPRQGQPGVVPKDSPSVTPEPENK